MKAFVTGGTGFIGSHLVEALIESDTYAEVRCLVRSDEKWLKNMDFNKVKGDLYSLNVISEALEDVDTLFHLAGVVKAPSWSAFERANVNATEDLIRIAEKKGVKKIVVLSSLAAAGPAEEPERPKTEKDPMHPVSMYGKSKKMMEQVIHEVAAGHDQLSVSILRPPAVYGPREDQIYTFFKMLSNRLCPIIGDGTRPRVSLVYVKDVVDATLKAAEHNRAGVETYFISGKRIHTWNEIRGTAEEVLGKKAVPIYIKPGTVKKVAGFVENVASLFGIYPVINREKANEMILEWTCSIEKAQKELGYNPRYSLAEGISRTIHWYQMHHWL